VRNPRKLARAALDECRRRDLCERIEPRDPHRDPFRDDHPLEADGSRKRRTGSERPPTTTATTSPRVSTAPSVVRPETFLPASSLASSRLGTPRRCRPTVGAPRSRLRSPLRPPATLARRAGLVGRSLGEHLHESERFSCDVQRHAMLRRSSSRRSIRFLAFFQPTVSGLAFARRGPSRPDTEAASRARRHSMM
jgi:hypothetical protein